GRGGCVGRRGGGGRRPEPAPQRQRHVVDRRGEDGVERLERAREPEQAHVRDLGRRQRAHEAGDAVAQALAHAQPEAARAEDGRRGGGAVGEGGRGLPGGGRQRRVRDGGG